MRGDKNNFFTHIYAQEEMQLQVSIELESFRSRVRCVSFVSLSIIAHRS